MLQLLQSKNQFDGRHLVTSFVFVKTGSSKKRRGRNLNHHSSMVRANSLNHLSSWWSSGPWSVVERLNRIIRIPWTFDPSSPSSARSISSRHWSRVDGIQNQKDDQANNQSCFIPAISIKSIFPTIILLHFKNLHV